MDRDQSILHPSPPSTIQNPVSFRASRLLYPRSQPKSHSAFLSRDLWECTISRTLTQHPSPASRLLFLVHCLSPLFAIYVCMCSDGGTWTSRDGKKLAITITLLLLLLPNVPFVRTTPSIPKIAEAVIRFVYATSFEETSLLLLLYVLSLQCTVTYCVSAFRYCNVTCS